MEACPLLPVGCWVVVLPEDPPTTIGSLVVLDQPPPRKAEVIRIGPECQYVQSGTRVAYKPFRGTEVELRGATWLLLNEEDVLAVLGEP
jgi:co-chaperonin GroES (HSP10)